jgi:dihydrodipicolinate synthase/N-acetylneuraminate lyase
MRAESVAWPIGILGVVQTPFAADGTIDWPSLDRLVEEVAAAGADGLLVPAVASENALLAFGEKVALARRVQAAVQGAVPVFWGAGSHDEGEVVAMATEARRAAAAGCLVAVPPAFYTVQAQIMPYFAQIGRQVDLPLMVQDLEFNGPGMQITTILELCAQVEQVRYLKVETVPAGPKYSAVLSATGGRVHVSGGWAVSQMIEALDRGVHAMIPECSMLRIYKAIDGQHRSGNREAARAVFNRLSPVLAFTNQQLDVSIRFFKRLLVRKGIFSSTTCRLPSPDFDAYQERVAGELIDLVLSIESELRAEAPPAHGRPAALLAPQESRSRR